MTTLFTLAERLKKLAAQIDKKKSRVLYHVGKRPVQPKPGQPTRLPDERHHDKTVAFLSPNWIKVWINYGIEGNVYKYLVPRAAIAEAGGVNIHVGAPEVVFSKEIWDKYNLGDTLVRKVYSRDEAASRVGKTERAHNTRLSKGRREELFRARKPNRNISDRASPELRERLKAQDAEEERRIKEDLENVRLN